MNRQQARHVKAMADKIALHIEAMQYVVKPLVSKGSGFGNLDYVSVETAIAKLEELEGHWLNINSVIVDMLPHMPINE